MVQRFQGVIPRKRNDEARPKVSAPKKKRGATARASTSLVTIDYPQENETIIHPSYAIRISADAGSTVAVSIDGGEWRPCRHAVGHWWLDWVDNTRGPHQIVARLCNSDGTELAQSEPRLCNRGGNP